MSGAGTLPALNGGSGPPGSTTLVARLSGRGGVSAAALLLYVLLGLLYFGLRLLIEPGGQYVGVFADPQIVIWSFAWWPHALLHGENPFVTHLVWAPTGVDLAWVNTVPVFAVALSPLTLLAGAVASYNLAAMLLPALSAWAAFLLCRRLTQRFWPSFLGGYLYGFSSYVLGHVIGQPQLTAVFVMPLVALVVLRALAGELGPRRLAVGIGVLLALQVYLSMELAFTLTLAFAATLVLGYLFAPASRRRLASLLRPILAGYLLAAVLAAPMLYYALTAVRISGFQPPGDYVADVANLVVPTHLVLLGAGWASDATARFPGNTSEQGSFLGVPLLVIVALYARRRWRSAAGRVLLVGATLATYFSLGPELTVYGHRVAPLPTPFGHNTLDIPGIGSKYVPLFDNTLPARFALYASLAVCVMAALWLSARPARDPRGWILAARAAVLLVPNPGAGVWASSYSIPTFFTDRAYRGCLAPGEIILPQPVNGQFTLWQVADDFRFRMAGGRLQTAPPSVFLHPGSIAQISVGYPPVADQARLLRAYIAREHVTAVILDKRQASIWGPSLDRIARPLDVGGVLLYRLARPGGRCSPA